MAPQHQQKEPEITIRRATVAPQHQQKEQEITIRKATVAPQQQQREWSHEITGRNATPEKTLALVEEHGEKFVARTLATAAHRVGKFGGGQYHHDPRLRRLAALCIPGIASFTAQELVNTAWGFAKTGFIDPKLFAEIARETGPRLGEFTSQGLTAMAQAFVIAGLASEYPCLFEAIAMETVPRINDFLPIEVIKMAGYFTKCRRLRVPDLYGAIASFLVTRRIEANHMDLAELAWAFPKAGFAAKPLFQAIAVQVEHVISKFTFFGLTTTAWGFAMTQCHREKWLFEAIANVVLQGGDPSRCEPNLVASLLYSFACIDLHHPRLFRILGNCFPKWKLDDLDRATKADLYLVCLSVVGSNDDFPLLASLPRLQLAFSSEDPFLPLRDDVAAVLKDLGWAFTKDHVTDIGIRLDLAQPDTKRAVLVVGPDGFFKDVMTGDLILSGATTFLARLLTDRGWRIAYVPALEWPTSHHDRRPFLANKLRHLSDDPFSPSSVRSSVASKYTTTKPHVVVAPVFDTRPIAAQARALHDDL